MYKLFFKLALLVSVAHYYSFVSAQLPQEYNASIDEDISSFDSTEYTPGLENYTCTFEEVDDTQCFKKDTSVPEIYEFPWALEMDDLPWSDIEKKLLVEHPNDTYLKAIVNNDSASILLSADDVNKPIKFAFCVKEDNGAFLYYSSIFTYLGFAITKVHRAKTEQEHADAYTLVKALLEKGAQPNALLVDVECQVQPEGCFWHRIVSSGTPATLAVSFKNPQVLELLFTYGACANSRSHDYEDLLAAAYPDLTLIDLIKRYLVLQKKENTCKEEFKDFSFSDELTCPKDGQKVVHSPHDTNCFALDDQAIAYGTY